MCIRDRSGTRPSRTGTWNACSDSDLADFPGSTPHGVHRGRTPSGHRLSLPGQLVSCEKKNWVPIVRDSTLTTTLGRPPMSSAAPFRATSRHGAKFETIRQRIGFESGSVGVILIPHRLKGGSAVVTMSTRFRTWSASQLMPCRCSSCLKPIKMVQGGHPIAGFTVTRGTRVSGLPLSPEGPR